MSDSRRRYDAVKDKLRQLLPEQWAECESRMINLSLFNLCNREILPKE